MSEELKPCPSCSGKPFIDFTRSPIGIRYNSVTCEECGLATKFYCDASKQKAYDSWNARPNPTFTKEDVEKALLAISDVHNGNRDEGEFIVKTILKAVGRVEE